MSKLNRRMEIAIVYKRKRILRNDSGITLIELLLVIAILSILVGMTGVSISLAFSRDCEACAKMIDGGTETARMTSMTKSGEFTLLVDAVNRKVTVTSDTGDTVFQKNIPQRVDVVSAVQGSGVSVTSINSLSLIFNKATGVVKSITADGTAIPKASTIRINCSNDKGKSATVKLITATGKHLIEYP